MAKNNDVFLVTIVNWSKHNKNKKKNHRYFLLENRFFYDSKIAQLSVGTCMTYVWLLSLCAESGSGQHGDTFECSVRHMPDTLKTGGGRLEDRLCQLQSFQLLIYEKKSFLFKTKQNKTIENKTKQNNKLKTEILENSSTQSAGAVDVVVASKLSNKFMYKLTANKEVQINRELLLSWQDQYPKEFLEQSLKDMRSWILANEHKAPKSAWGKFMNNWFARGWERYRTTLKSEPKKMSYEEFEEMMKKESIL